MARYNGSQKIRNRYFGSQKIQRRYLGTRLVYQAREPKLYMVNGESLSASNLYILNSQTGVAIEKVGRNLLPVLGQGMTFIDDTLYLVGFERPFSALYTVDLETPAITKLGNLNQLNSVSLEASAMAYDESTVYILDDTHNNLSTLNLTTRTVTRIGTANHFGSVNETNPQGLTFLGNTLYMVGNRNDMLYTVDTTTGVATRVGNSERFGIRESNPTGLTTIGNQLYMVGEANDVLYTLNTTTGAATQVGNSIRFGVGAIKPQGLAYGPV